MIRHSYNGWTVIEDVDTDTMLETVETAGRKFRVRKGDVAVVFQELIDRFHAEVEPIDVGVLDDWSYVVRLTRGSSDSLSCHSSGTAVDLNAVQHPRGVRATFTPDQRVAIRRILADLPCIRWGADFSTTVDDMHFEITDVTRGGSAADVRRVADAIRAKNQPPPEEDIMATADEAAKAFLRQSLDNEATAAAHDAITVKDALEQTHRWALFGALTAPVGIIAYESPAADGLWLDLGTARRLISPAQWNAILAAAVARRDPRDPKVSAVVDPRLVVPLPSDDPFWKLPVFDPAAPAV